jgi:dTDP-D-glucose 4,6-dehydratase
MLAISYANTNKFPLHIVNTMHLFGEDDVARKFIPATVAKLLAGEPAVVYGFSTRHWLYIEDFCDRLVYELHRGNQLKVGGVHRHHLIGKQMSCAELGLRIAQVLGKPYTSVNSNYHLNPGHTAHYSTVSDMPYSNEDLMRGLTKTVEAIACTTQRHGRNHEGDNTQHLGRA